MASSRAYIQYLQAAALGSLPSAELQQFCRDLWSGALHKAAAATLACHWPRMCHALVPRQARTQRTDAASEH